MLLVLTQISALSHQIAAAGDRVFVMVVSVFFFQNHLENIQIIGMIVCVLGMGLYQRAKYNHDKKLENEIIANKIVFTKLLQGSSSTSSPPMYDDVSNTNPLDNTQQQQQYHTRRSGKDGNNNKINKNNRNNNNNNTNNRYDHHVTMAAISSSDDDLDLEKYKNNKGAYYVGRNNKPYSHNQYDDTDNSNHGYDDHHLSSDIAIGDMTNESNTNNALISPVPVPPSAFQSKQ